MPCCFAVVNDGATEGLLIQCTAKFRPEILSPRCTYCRQHGIECVWPCEADEERVKRLTEEAEEEEEDPEADSSSSEQEEAEVFELLSEMESDCDDYEEFEALLLESPASPSRAPEPTTAVVEPSPEEETVEDDSEAIWKLQDSAARCVARQDAIREHCSPMPMHLFGAPILGKGQLKPRRKIKKKVGKGRVKRLGLQTCAENNDVGKGKGNSKEEEVAITFELASENEDEPDLAYSLSISDGEDEDKLSIPAKPPLSRTPSAASGITQLSATSRTTGSSIWPRGVLLKIDRPSIAQTEKSEIYKGSAALTVENVAKVQPESQPIQSRLVDFCKTAAEQAHLDTCLDRSSLQKGDTGGCSTLIIEPPEIETVNVVESKLYDESRLIASKTEVVLPNGFESTFSWLPVGAEFELQALFDMVSK